MQKSFKKFLFFFIHPVVNIPPPLNFASLLSSFDQPVIIIGYLTDDTKKIEKIAKSAWIFRIPLTTRNIPLKPLRLALGLIEYLIISVKIIKRVAPDCIVTFNDPATVILYLARSVKYRLAWILEFPEHKYLGKVQYRLMRFTSRYLKYASALIFPTRERMALTLEKQSSCIDHRKFIIHNAPLLDSEQVPSSSPLTKEGVRFLNENRLKGKINIIYTGAVGNRYGIDQLIGAVAGTEAFCLLIVGKKHDLSIKEVAEAMDRAGNKDSIKFIDQVPYNDLPLLFKNSDIGHVYYKPDTLNTLFSAPGKLYEYLKGGLMILTDKNACIINELIANSCCLIFDFNDKQALMEKLNWLAGNRDYLTKAKANARRLSENVYNFKSQSKYLFKYLNV
ncbi:MAG: glycosyltransferase [Fulvivirga sp.]|nr:glycosyltransferase [Fulvivirga sp.]